MDVHCQYIRPEVNMLPRSDIEAMDQPPVLYISYGECATDEPFCVRGPNIFKMMPFFTRRLICHIMNLVAIRNFLWLCNRHTIYISKT